MRFIRRRLLPVRSLLFRLLFHLGILPGFRDLFTIEVIDFLPIKVEHAAGWAGCVEFVTNGTLLQFIDGHMTDEPAGAGRVLRRSRCRS